MKRGLVCEKKNTPNGRSDEKHLRMRSGVLRNATGKNINTVSRKTGHYCMIITKIINSI